MTKTAYQPKDYWGKLVSGNRDLSNVGHPSLGKFNQVAYPFRLAALQKALKGADLQRLRIFEAGFGECFYLRFWHSQGAGHVAGMDISEAAFRTARKCFPSYDLKNGDLSNTADFKSFGEYDLVTAIDVLYHLVDDAQWCSAVQNLAQRVKKGGLFIFTEKFPKVGSYQSVAFAKRRSLDQWDGQLKKEGLTRIRIFPVFVFMDDPLLCGQHSWLGHLSMLQWKIATKLIRLLQNWPNLRDTLGVLYGGLLFFPEKILLNLLKRTPNLELVVYKCL